MLILFPILKVFKIWFFNYKRNKKRKWKKRKKEMNEWISSQNAAPRPCPWHPELAALQCSCHCLLSSPAEERVFEKFIRLIYQRTHNILYIRIRQFLDHSSYVEENQKSFVWKKNIVFFKQLALRFHELLWD